MAIVLYDTLVPDVQVYANGCPAPSIVDALRKAARQFFYESLAYRSWLAAVDLTINITNYTLTGLPAQTDVAQIMQLKCDGLPVDEKTHEEFLFIDPAWPSLTGTNAQYYTTLGQKGTFDIIPKPTATITGGLRAQVAVMPTITATGLEQKYLEEFKDALVDGALSRLLMIKDRVWSDNHMAVVRLTDFQRWITLAKIQASKGNVRRDVSVQMRRWV